MYTSDKQIAEKRLREKEIELQKEKEGIIPSLKIREGINKSLIEFKNDFLNELKTLNRSEKHGNRTQLPF